MVQVEEPEKLVDEIKAALGELSSLKSVQNDISNMLNQLKDSDDALERVMSDESHEKVCVPLVARSHQTPSLRLVCWRAADLSRAYEGEVYSCAATSYVEYCRTKETDCPA